MNVPQHWPKGILFTFPLVLLAVLPGKLLSQESPGVTEIQAALTRSNLQAGLIVHMGTTDAKLESQIANQTDCVVLGIAPDPTSGQRCRELLAEKELIGRATIMDHLDFSRVPLVDETVLVLIANLDQYPKAHPRQKELLRAVRPGGILYVGKNGKWTETIKSMPANYDSWPQYFHDSSGNDSSKDKAVGPVRGLQWAACDYGTNNRVGLRLQNGIMIGAEALEENTRGGSDVLVARDAFSGIQLWERPDISVTNRYTLILDEHAVYCLPDENRGYAKHMIALDLATGKTLRTFDQGLDFSVRQVANARFRLWPQATLHDGNLVQVIDNHLCVLDAKSGKQIWSKDYPKGSYVYLPTVMNGKLIVVQGEKWGRSMAYLRGWDCCKLDAIIAYDLKTGKEQWQYKQDFTELPTYVFHMVTASGKLVAATYSGGRDGRKDLVCLNVATGKTIWQRQVDDRGTRGHGSNWRVLIQGDRVWSTQLRTARSFSLEKGEPLTEKQYSFFIGWCQPVRATPDYLMAALFLMKPGEGEVLRCDASRSACDIGSFPAYGRIFGTATNCGCEAFLPGTNVFNSIDGSQAEFAGTRLHPGKAKAAPPKEPSGNKAWPIYMRDHHRSNWCEVNLQPKLEVVWKSTYPNPLKNLPKDRYRDWYENPYIGAHITAPVVAEGIAIAALPHQHTVVALDAAKGKERWRLVADGRVDSPPTIHNCRVLFGTRNGWIYAVNRDTGELIWRFLAAPNQRQLIAFGQPESAWPSFGTVLIHKNLAWITAGRSAQTDGGIRWYALNVETGEPVKSGVLDGMGDWITQGRGKNQSTLQPKQPITSATPFTLTQDEKQLLMWNSGVKVATGKSLRGGIEIWPAGASNYIPEQPLADAIFPGQYGLVQNGKDGGGRYGRAAFYAGVRGKIIAYRGDDFIALCSNGGYGGRGGSPGPLERWKKRQTPQPKARSEAFATKVWTSPDHPKSARDNYHLQQALVKAGDHILVGLGNKIVFYRYADGSKIGEVSLPGNVVHNGLAVVGNKVYVTCADGSFLCLQ